MKSKYVIRKNQLRFKRGKGEKGVKSMIKGAGEHNSTLGNISARNTFVRSFIVSGHEK
jgi:hypothetical protein